jgi:hypothetical protein
MIDSLGIMMKCTKKTVVMMTMKSSSQLAKVCTLTQFCFRFDVQCM